MAQGKLSVTLEEEIIAELRRTVGPRQISAFVNKALRQRLQAARVQALLAKLQQESGLIPAEVQA